MNRPESVTARQPKPAASDVSAEPDVSRIVWVDANGTAWRMRSLVAMGHSATRIAGALGIRVESVQKLLRGDAALIGTDLQRLASQLWDAWWDKRPPESTAAERRASAAARRRAETNNWCAPVGLDEDQLDEPGYRPYCRYRPASGNGVAADFQPVNDPPNETAEEIA
jgi:hypothetical protein